MNYLTALLILIFTSYHSLSIAHVRIDSPKGGESLIPFSEISIEWTETQDHGENNWDLYYSLDGGIVWMEINLDVEESLLVYAWQVPNAETSSAKIKIIQDNSSGPDYEDISDNFTISSNPSEINGDPELITALDDKSDYSIDSIELFNYPNPFNSSTTIQFSIAKKSHVDLTVYNVLGKIVFRGVDDILDEGTYKIPMKNLDLHKGIYFSSLTTNDQKITNKMIFRP